VVRARGDRLAGVVNARPAFVVVAAPVGDRVEEQPGRVEHREADVLLTFSEVRVGYFGHDRRPTLRGVLPARGPVRHVVDDSPHARPHGWRIPSGTATPGAACTCTESPRSEPHTQLPAPDRMSRA